VANLESRSAQRRDQEAGDDRAVDAGLRRQPGRDRKRHRQRKRDETDGQARDQVSQKNAGVVAGRERQDRSRQPFRKGASGHRAANDQNVAS
jgi:hypothetical protein